MKLTYSLQLTRGARLETKIPTLKEKTLIPRSIKFSTPSNKLTITLKAKDTLLSINQGSLLYTKHYDLTSVHKSISDVEDNCLILTINNKSNQKEALEVLVVLEYQPFKCAMVYSNYYTNLNTEGLKSLMTDIRQSSKKIDQIILLSEVSSQTEDEPSALLVPIFSSEPEWLPSYKFRYQSEGHQLILDQVQTQWLDYYRLVLSESINKVGLIIKS